MSRDLAALLDAVVEIARRAGRKALEFYGDSSGVVYKDDRSPLTRADRASHRLILDALRELTPEIPAISEESPENEVEGRRGWPRLWLVDPLDGSKEFLKRTGEFTVNIAVVDRAEPVLGVIHVPVSGATYTALSSRNGEAGAWVERPGSPREPIRVRKAVPDRLTIVASKDHAGPRVKKFIESVPRAEVSSMGSSLKFCLVAEGKADFYPRIVPTMEWDTAAAQCLLESAGGRVTDLEGRRLAYNKESLRNPPLIAFGDQDVDWVELFDSRS